MRRPSNAGKSIGGLLSKKSAEGGQDDSVCGSVGLLPVAYGGAHLCSGGKDACPQREPHERSPFSDEWHHARWQALHVRAGASLLKAEDAVRFLKHLMGQIPCKLLVIWDGSPIHRGGALKDFLSSGAARGRVQLEQLPGYAPDLNPDEGVWKHLKCVERAWS